MDTFKQRMARPFRSYAAVWGALFFALGVFIAPKLNAGLWLLAPAAALIALVPLFKRLHIRLLPLMICACFALGMARGVLSLTAPTAKVGKKLTVVGTVYGGASVAEDGRVRFFLSQASVEGESSHTKVYCTLYPKGDEALPLIENGMRVSVTGTVYQPGEKRGEHDFDFRMRLYQQGAKLGVTASGAPSILPERRLGDPFYTMRQALSASLERVMGEDARLPIALLLGQRDSMEESELEQFRRLGVAHLMSVSGLHVSLLGGALLWLLGKLGAGGKCRLLVMVGFMLLYSLLTGFSAATQRASVMLLTAMVYQLDGSQPDPVIALALSMLFVLLLGPLQLFSAGFVLSYAATGAILLLTRRFALLLPVKKNKPLKALRDTLCASAAASIGVSVPTANTFHRLPVYGILANLLLVPPMEVLMPLYTITLLLSPVPLLGSALGFLSKLPTRAFLWLTNVLSQLPAASLRVPEAPAVASVAVALGILILSDYVRAGAVKRLLALTLCALLAAFGAYMTKPASLRYIQLSCGQADAALILTDQTTLAIDVGADGSEVAGYLLAENRDIDALFLSHLHLDHAGGLQRLLDEEIVIKHIYLPEAADQAGLSAESLEALDIIKGAGIPVTTLAAGDKVAYDRGEAVVLWPERGRVHLGKDGNESSMALRITLDSFTLMSCADVPSDYEQYFVMPCDILKVAHHGSADATDRRFLQAAAPQLALISCGGTNERLPAAETLNFLQALDIPYYRTDRTGDVTLTIQGESLTLTRYRREE